MRRPAALKRPKQVVRNLFVEVDSSSGLQSIQLVSADGAHAV